MHFELDDEPRGPRRSKSPLLPPPFDLYNYFFYLYNLAPFYPCPT